ncbi:MAG: 3-deoxy-D-manno-octulosonic acid transferase [Acidobacteria bacterium]|nr:3-deoxy-D-manno-octulosonic acid transferase [Acidobacteriota bacterium]
MYWIYSAILGLGLLLSMPYWLWQALRHGKYRAGLGERLGGVPARLGSKPGRTIWVHAVSVGEVLAVSGLVPLLRQRFPEHRVLVSTTTDTGQKLARARFEAENVFYFPLDFGFAVRRYMQALKPELVVLAETEFWPNFLRAAQDSGARVVVVNARISDRSLPGYRRAKRFFRRILQAVDLFLTQTWEDKKRLHAIGVAAERVEVSGNLKFDVPMPDPPPIVAQLRSTFQYGGTHPVLVCGSTVTGEEPLLLSAFQQVLASYPQAVMLLAPRHPERFGEVAQLLQSLGVRFWKRSAWKGEQLRGGVFLLDSIGELAALYALADIAFVGGSLVPRGGHNILEPAMYGAAIVVGNHTENFRDIVWLFQNEDAVRIVGPAELPIVWMELLADEADRHALGRRALETLRSQMGATQKTLEALQKLLQPVESKVSR